MRVCFGITGLRADIVLKQINYTEYLVRITINSIGLTFGKSNIYTKQSSVLYDLRFEIIQYNNYTNNKGVSESYAPGRGARNELSINKQ